MMKLFKIKIQVWYLVLFTTLLILKVSAVFWKTRKNYDFVFHYHLATSPMCYLRLSSWRGGAFEALVVGGGIAVPRLVPGPLDLALYETCCC